MENRQFNNLYLQHKKRYKVLHKLINLFSANLLTTLAF